MTRPAIVLALTIMSAAVVNRNLEDDLTNDVLTNLSGPMTDSFRQKRYGEGVINYVNAIIEKLQATSAS
jgi:hypothetical protein